MMLTYICSARRMYDGSVSIALPSDSNTFTKWPVLAIYSWENAFYCYQAQTRGEKLLATKHSSTNTTHAMQVYKAKSYLDTGDIALSDQVKVILISVILDGE